MKVKYRLLSVLALMLVAVGGFLVSCEDDCKDCAGNMRVDYVISSTDKNTHLTELATGQTVIIVGENLSSVIGVYLDDTPLALNPAFITDNSILVEIVGYTNTKNIYLYAKDGSKLVYELPRPVPAPRIDMAYSEFVPDGGVLKLKGAYFFGTPAVYFYNEEGAEIPSLESDSVYVNSSFTELHVKVPEGVANSKPVRVVTDAGIGESKFRFRDRRNIFLDFDVLKASADGGAINTIDPLNESQMNWIATLQADANYAAIMNLLGGSFPKGCDGLYSAVTHGGFNFKSEDMIYYVASTSGRDNPQTNLLGSFQNESLENLVLKFEIYIPKEFPLTAWFNVIFSKYLSEDSSPYEGYATSYFPREFTASNCFDTDAMACESACTEGIPAAWFCPGELDVSGEDTETPSAKYKDGIYTNGWMTVAIPLSSSIFRYAPSSWGLVTNDLMGACATLTVNDFYNFFIHCDATAEQRKLNRSLGNGMADYFFCGFDNFRIVPEDGDGAKFGKFGNKIRYY